MAAWAMGRVNSFLKGSRKHDLDLRKKKKKEEKQYPRMSSVIGRIKNTTNTQFVSVVNLHHSVLIIDLVC